MWICFRVVLLLLLSTTFIKGSYIGRRWTHLETLQQDPDVYSRSPFVMQGRGVQTVLSGFNRINPQMYIDMKTWENGANKWTVTAVMDPPDSYPAIIFNISDILYQGSNYGVWLASTETLETGLLFAASAPRDPIYVAGTRLNESGSVYIYRGAFSEWTNTQKLLPSQIDLQIFFGDSVSLCPKVPTNMAIGAHGDRSTGLYQSGAAYIFRSTPTGRYWTETQKLIARDQAEADWFGYRVVLYDEFLMVSNQYDDDNGEDSGSLYIFREERSHGVYMWSQQQVLFSPGVSVAYGEFASLHTHTLVVGSNFEDETGGSTRTGAVYVYKTYKTLEMPYEKPSPTLDERRLVAGNDPAPKPKPKPVPMFKWWSQQQKLLARDWHTYRYFGTYTTIHGDGNLIATGAFGEAFSDPIWEYPVDSNLQGPNWRSGSAYIFVKDEKYDRWTQQQKFVSPTPKKGDYFSDPYLHGSDLIIRNTKFGYIYSDNVNWNCLMVDVWDQFGDGWDITHLVAYAPGSNTKLTDQYAPTCTSKNPLTFRYCPLHPEDAGMYYFKFEDNVFRSQYWADAMFKIYNEKDLQIYYGDAHTSIGFEWDSDNLEFNYVPSKEDRLVDNSKCNSCNDHRAKPKPKPTPHKLANAELEGVVGEESGDEPSPSAHEGLIRELKGKSSTSHPTISPAPTLAYSVVLDPLRVQMSTTDFNGWHGIGPKNGTGTWWHIYDSYGKKLIYSGTMCGLGPVSVSWSDDCDVVEIPDGHYVFRVGGAIDAFKGSHTWSFCGVSGGATEMFSFEVKNRQCIPYNSYTATDYCLRKLGMTLVTSGIIELYGAPTSLSEGDLEGLRVAVTHLLSPAHVKRVDVELATDTGSVGGVGVMIKFKAHVDIFSLGFEVSDANDMNEVFEVLSEQLETSTMSGQLVNEIVAAAEEVYGDHRLMNIRGAKLISVTNEGLEMFANPFLHKSGDVSVAGGSLDNEDPVMTSQQLKGSATTQILEVSSEGGYVMLGVIGMLVIGVVWRIYIRTDIRKRRPYRGMLRASSQHTKSSPVKMEEGDKTADKNAPIHSADEIISDFSNMLSELNRMADMQEESADSVLASDSMSNAAIANGRTKKMEGRIERKESSIQVMSDFAGMLDDLKMMAEIEDEALKPFRKPKVSSIGENVTPTLTASMPPHATKVVSNSDSSSGSENECNEPAGEQG